MEEFNKAMVTKKGVQLPMETAVRFKLRSGDRKSELDAGPYHSASYEQENLEDTVGGNERKRQSASNNQKNQGNAKARNKRRRQRASNNQKNQGNAVGRNEPNQEPREPIDVTFSKHARDYNMNHKNRGICLIFNHENFDDKKSKPRVGTEYDVNRISNTFKNLSFIVEVVNDATRDQIYNKLDTVKETNHTDNDCLCIFVLTHGRRNVKGNQLQAKDEFYYSDEIWKRFTGDNCRTLAGKPKLFFYQACRGELVDSGISLRTSSTDSQIDAASATWKIPIRSDMLFAHSTADGYVAWREELMGTPYIQNLCSVIDFCTIELDRKCDLLEILTITARQLAITFESYSSEAEKNQKKQISSFTSMLIRKLYLVPK